MRQHRNGNHEECSEGSCLAAKKLARKAGVVINNRAILEFCLLLGIPLSHLGSELAAIRASAQTHIPEAMQEDYEVDFTELCQARFTVEGILRENGYDWNVGALPSDAVKRVSERVGKI
jgi:hypothetical protein